MQPWKALAIKKLGLRPGANDRVVLDEILRVDIRGGSTILRIRDHFAVWTQEQIKLGQITTDESACSMAGIISLVQKLRVRGRREYEIAVAFPLSDDEMSFNEDDFQPNPVYED